MLTRPQKDAALLHALAGAPLDRLPADDLRSLVQRIDALTHNAHDGRAFLLAMLRLALVGVQRELLRRRGNASITWQ